MEITQSMKEAIYKVLAERTEELDEGRGGRFDRTGPAMSQNSADIEKAAKAKFGAKTAKLSRQGRMEFPTKDRNEALKIHKALIDGGFTAGRIEVDKSYDFKKKEWKWIVYHNYKLTTPRDPRKKEYGFAVASIELYDNYHIAKGEIIPKRDPGPNELARGIPVTYGKQ